MPRPPNILYIHSHDTGRWIAPYGCPVRTPTYDRLAAEGTVFLDNHCAAPTCSPSRAALLTGETPHQAGMLGLAHRGMDLRHPERHLATTLRRAGYRTALAGLQHVMGKGRELEVGYERNLGGGFNGHSVAGDFMAAHRHEPFFLDVGFFETHRPFPPAGDTPAFTPPLPLQDRKEVRDDLACYHAMLKVLDSKISTVLDELDRHGLAGNTLVICTTDHGPAFPGFKCQLTARGTGTLLIIRGPGFAPGRRVSALTSHLDIFPTLCSAAGIPAPAWLQGQPLQGLVDGSRTKIRDEATAEVTWHAAYEPQRAIRTQSWSYIRRYGDRKAPVLPNIDDSPCKDLALAEGLATSELPREELYDLAADPQELHNIVASQVHCDALAAMRGRLDAWMRHTADPLLAGDFVAPPVGYTYNPVEQLTPTGPLETYR